MQLILTTREEREILSLLEEKFGKDIAEDMMRAVNRNQMSAYGAYMVRKRGGFFHLLYLPCLGGKEIKNA